MVYNYTRERNVGLLEDLFTAVKDTGMIIDLEVISFHFKFLFDYNTHIFMINYFAMDERMKRRL